MNLLRQFVVLVMLSGVYLVAMIMGATNAQRTVADQAVADSIVSAMVRPLPPRVMLYAATEGGGWPAVDRSGAVDDAVLRALARWPLITVNATPWLDVRKDLTARLRALNQRQRVLAYDTVTERFAYETPGTQWGDEWRALRAYMLTDTAGRSWPYPGARWPLGWVNFGAAAAADTAAGLWIRHSVEPGLAHGIFGDFMGSDIWWARSPENGAAADHGAAGFRSAAAMDSARRVNMARMVARARAAAGPGWLFVGNGATTPREWQVGWDGEMREGWRPEFLERYMKDSRSWGVVKAETWAAPYSAEWCRLWRYAMGCAAMGNGYAFVGPDRDLKAYQGTTYLMLWPDEASVTPLVPGVSDGRTDTTGAHVGWLGEAVAPPDSIGPGLWRRNFQHGTVLLCNRDTPGTFDMQRPYWRPIYGLRDRITNNGRARSVYQVGAHDALFLLAVPRAVPSPQARRL